MTHTFEEICAHTDLLDRIQQQMALKPDHPAYDFVSFPNDTPSLRTVTLREVDERAKKLAGVLQTRRVEPGDRVVLLCTQSLDDVVGVLGCLYARAVFCLIPPPTDAPELERLRSVLSSSGARVVASGQHLLSALADRLEQATRDTTVELIDITATSSADARVWQPRSKEGELVFLQYTSGSTGAPKAIMVSHRNVLHNVACFLHPPPELAAERYAIWVPFFHNVGLMTLFMPLLGAVSVSVMSPRDFMAQPERWFRLIHERRAQGTIAPHSAYAYCAKAIAAERLSNLDLSCLSSALNGAEAIELGSLEAFADKFAVAGFRMQSFAPAYGLGEATCGVTRASPHLVKKTISADDLGRNRLVEVASDHPRAKTVVSVGRPLPGIKLCIVDPMTLRECKDGEIGELWVQGPSVAVGYWNDARSTQEAFAARLPGADGTWLRTGDLAALLDGELYITGRSKEVVIVNGHNLYPNDIEVGLRRAIPELRDSRIATFSHLGDGNERVVCCLERSPMLRQDLLGLARDIAEQVARVYQFSPHDVVVVRENSLPRTANGKLQTLRIRDRYLASQLATLVSLKDSIAVEPKAEPEPAWTEEQRRVGALFRELLALEVVRLDDSFFLLGGTSLGITQLASRIHASFGVDPPIQHLLDAPSIRGIARLLLHWRTTGRLEGEARQADDWARECALDPTIAPGTPAHPARAPKQIFLTGATGFVGAYLLRDLLAATDATVHCLVRADGEEQGRRRLRENLEFYGLWHESLARRIVPVSGDLTRPLLGLERESFQHLAETVDAIYHNAALLNFVYPYRMLRAANVCGTTEALRLACLGKAKAFHHVSTYSVYDNPSHFRKVAAEDDLLDDARGYLLGYSESKWVAEKLVRAAFARGLRGCIFRPGEVTGDSATGIWKCNDLVIRALLASVRARALPSGAMRFHMTPVDYVSAAITHISLDESCWGEAYNLLNANVPSHGELAPWICALGYPVDVVEFDEWKTRLLALPQDSPFKPLESLFKEGRTGDEAIERRYGSAQPQFDSSNARRALAATSIRCPPVDGRLLKTYFDYFIRAGYLPPADRPA